jgi:hypothetical protein
MVWFDFPLIGNDEKNMGFLAGNFLLIFLSEN